jgi:hypothetical protein
MADSRLRCDRRGLRVGLRYREAASRLLDSGHPVEALAVAVEFQPDFRVAPDHGARGPELVGDFGEELGPGAGGLSERFLSAPALADAARGGLEADNLTAFVEYRFREGLEPSVVSRQAIPDPDRPRYRLQSRTKPLAVRCVYQKTSR